MRRVCSIGGANIYNNVQRRDACTTQHIGTTTPAMLGGASPNPTLTEALLGVPPPEPAPDPSELLLGGDEHQQPRLVPAIRVVDPHQACDCEEVVMGVDTPPAPPSSLLVSIILLAKTILGAGMTALPRATALLGLLLAPALLALVAWMTHFSIQALTLGTMATGLLSYPELTKELLGRPAAVVLELALILRCSGLMVVYVIVSADVLAGTPKLSGLLCDLLGAAADGWCDSRPLVAGLLVLLVLAPLVSLRRLSSTALASYVGVAAVLVWAAATAAVAAAAGARGLAHRISLLPDWPDLGATDLGKLTQLLAIIPIIATAFTCQMSVSFIQQDMRPFTAKRMATASASAVLVSLALFLLVAIGSAVAFGSEVPADVLEMFNESALEPIVGSAWAPALGAVVRFGFLLSVLGIFPMQMWPMRESLSRLAFGQELRGPAFYLLTYLSLAGVYAAAMGAGSIWVPLQLVGATAGALIAFFFPAAVGLAAVRSCPRTAAAAPGYWRANAYALAGLGAVQAVTGIAAVWTGGSRPD